MSPAADSAFRRTAARYRPIGRFAHGYVASKLRRDPVHRVLIALAAQENFLAVLDIGCGRGQLGIALLEAGGAASVLGLDRNSAHLRQAERAAQGLAFRAGWQDLARSAALPAADTVIIVDVLYQLDTAAQVALLEAAARAARSRLLIRTADPARGWRSAVTRGLELVGRRVWPHSGARVNALPIATIAARLGELGFSVAAEPCWQGTPFANLLLVCRRSASGGGSA